MPENNLLILGYGSIGKKHAANASQLGVRTVTVDPDSASGAGFTALGEALLANSPGFFSHALIASPAAWHLSSLEEVLASGISQVLVEKPLCLPQELSRMRELSGRLNGNQKVYVGFNWRFNSAVRRLREAVSADALGKVQIAQLYAREWLPKYGGNVLLESGSHILDTARYLLGDLRLAGAQLLRQGQLGESDESVSILLSNQQRADIYVHVNFINKDAYDYRILLQGSRATQECRPDRRENMHLLELEAFLNAPSGVLAGLEDGIRNLELIHEIVESSKALV